MNVVFLTLARISNIKEGGIYNDLMCKFIDEGHHVYIVAPFERRFGFKTSLSISFGAHILYVKTLNIQKTNIIEKGLGILLLERQYKAAINKYFKNITFDLITYSTPPITFTNVVKYLKRKNPYAISYLQLKDIFPQNAVDIGMFSKKSLIYWYFRKKEVGLYRISDFIGCMSPANVDFVLKHNPDITPSCVEIAPNSLSLRNIDSVIAIDEKAVREKYGLPQDRPIFIYGGNLGKPQGIPYLIECLDANSDREDCFFVIIGSGTEYPNLKRWVCERKPNNVRVMEGLPKKEYDELVRACDVGLIFLDHRFTIPNYPSRLLSYLENKMPVLCATDPNTDIGSIAEENGYGYWCESVNPADFTALVDKMLKSNIKKMGENGFDFLKRNYLVEHTYQTIVKHIKQ